MTAFVRPRRLDAPALRLAVIHHAGGSAAAYFPLHRGLPDDWDLLLLDLPGRGKRHGEAPSADMAELVDRAVEDLLPWSGSAPLALFGHSLGSVVAFEVAHALEDRGVPVAWVGVSGRPGPKSPVPAPRLDPALPDEELLHGLARLGGLPSLFHEHPDLRHRFLGLIRADLRALGTYRPDPLRRPLSAHLTAFGAVDDPLAPPDSLNAWAGETAGEFGRRLLPGGHFHFLSDSFTRFTRLLTAEIRTRVPSSPTEQPSAAAGSARTAV
ncbi:thioesterase II family protein [Streptomyces sp. NPDC101151]|uniref:thioesterase II family protein n=1 Tax=Streptomyces sp. NPDC101151 TaxID=3366115 RepID=UPI0038104605